MSEFEEERSPLYKEDVDIKYFVSYVKALSALKEKSKALTTVDSKLYYKLRHNLLKTYCCVCLGMESYQEKPFSDFPILGLDSKRTPDLLFITDNEAILVEFTVSNRYDTVLKTKEYFGKYDKEVSESWVPIHSYYVYLALDSDASDAISVIKTISHRHDIVLHNDPEPVLSDVLETIKAMTAYISDFMPEILSMNIDAVRPVLNVNTIDVQQIFPESKQLMGKKSFKNQRVKSLLLSSIRKLSQSLKKRMLDTDYRIKINFITRNVYLFESPGGARKHELIDLLDTHSGRLLDLVDVVGDVYNESEVFSQYEFDPNVRLDADSRPSDEQIVVDTQSYENRLKSALHKYPMNTLINCSLEEAVDKVASVYMANQTKLIEKLKPNPYNKSPFIFNPNDIVVKGKFNLKVETGEKITDRVIAKAFGYDIPKVKVIERDIDYDGLLALEKENTKLWLALREKLGLEAYRKLNKMPMKKLLELGDEDAKTMIEFREKRGKLSGLVKERTRTTYRNRVRINLRADNSWEEETTHFKSMKNKHRHVSGLDFDSTHENYKAFVSELFNPTDTPISDSVFLDTDPLGKTLASLCSDMKGVLEEKAQPFTHTLMAHSLQTISQFCYSLTYYSNIKLNKDDFMYDNLGNTETLLIVKGGKTVRRTKVSRFFRLLTPITQCQAEIVKSHSNKIVSVSGKLYLLTPWRMLRFDYLKKGIEMLHSYSAYYIANSLESGLDHDNFNKFMTIKTLMVFSQKRRLEVWLSTLRYIYLNALGTHSDVLALVESMPMLDHDSLTFVLQRCFCQSYKHIYLNAKDKKLHDIFWNTTVDNFDLVAERFEETMFMTKAPFNPHNEHIKNLKSLFDTHRYYMSHVGSLDPLVGLEKTAVEIGDNYFGKLEECDFNFDPKMSYIVGDFLGAFVSSSCTKADMQTKLNEIFERSYTEIATSKGMRASKGYFWGQKGNEVVYDNLNIDIANILEKFPDNPKDYNKLVSEHEISFMEKISSIENLNLEFDMKDKRQYKDSREIYVMSENTKLMQNPIEKFFSFLCRFVPNELIQRPSNTRPKFIHYKMFEHKRDKGVEMYCTMDCRKWAPRSNLWKYYFFVKGMSKYLPQSFTEYFFKFWTLMFKKRVRIQKKFIENLMTNEGYKDILDFLIERDDGDFELLMPYSFMMGIFNYLSSIMHAASQLYFNDVVLSNTGSSANFLAHSDDSAGVISSRTYSSCIKIYDQYEKFQRTLNHLMSKKKCCLSERSFEMISIMYCDSRYIPMTHKFMSNIALDFKGGGWYDDVTAIFSKVVDLYNSGGSHLQCYCLMLSMGELLRKAYHLPRSKLLSHIPLPFGGVPNFHPMHVLMVGSVAQECLLDLVEDDRTRRARLQAYIEVAGDYMPGSSETLRYRIPYHKSYDKRVNIGENERNLLAAVSTLPDKNTLVSYAKHVNKTYDLKYVYSLTGFDTDQIALATLFYRHSILLADDKPMLLSDFQKVYITVYLTGVVDAEIKTDVPKGNYSSYFDQVESMKFELSDFTVKSGKSCKPVLYNTIENFDVKVNQNNLMYLSAIEKDPRLKNILQNKEKYEFLKDYLMSSLPGTKEEKEKFLRLYNPQEKEEKSRSGYLFLPSGVSIDTPARFFTYSMLYTTRRYLISKKRPQLFTPAEFNLESKGINDLKHVYLLIKLIEKESISLEEALRSLKECPICKEQTSAEKTVKKFFELFNNPENRDFQTRLPFVDYHKRQRKGKNVWYANADFTLHTPFGRVTSTEVEGEVWTTWEVSDSNYLSALWMLYRIFCSSRGIKAESPSFSHTGFTQPKLAFNDFDTPYIPPLQSKAIVIANSKVLVKQVFPPYIFRRGRKFYMNDRVLDFKIYSVNDVNRLLYETHMLSGLKELIYKSDLSISEELLLKSFSSSKSYKVILHDERHYSEDHNKYIRNGLLGQPGSFTRALALADEEGFTRYRSSYNQTYINKGVIEFDSVEGVPVLDMFEKVNYARMNFGEKMAFEKVLSGSPLNTTDKEAMIRLKNKMGLEALGTAVVLHKHVFEAMIAGSVISIPKNILMDVFSCLIDAISESMEPYPETNTKFQFTQPKSAFWKLIKECLQSGARRDYLDVILARALLRSKADNPYKFWEVIKGNILLSSMTIHSNYYANLISMLAGILVVLKDQILDVFYDRDGNPRYKGLALARTNIRRCVDKPSSLTHSNYKTGQPIAFIGGDFGEAMDAYYEDPDDFDEDEFETEVVDREYDEDGKKLKVFTMSPMSVRGICEKILDQDYRKISIYNPVEYVSYPWLGKGNFKKKTVDGVEFYVSEFPGESVLPPAEMNKVVNLKSRSLIELEVEEKVEDVETPSYTPKCLADRSSAIKTLSSLGMYDRKLVDAIFPETRSANEVLKEYLDSYLNVLDVSGGVRLRRTSKKAFLPGFQGVLEDKILTAEMRALFGDNCYHIFTGNVKMSESSYKYFMRVLKRMSRFAGIDDKALIMTLISLMLDTTIEEDSDPWFVEKMTKIVEEMDSRLYDDEGILLLPVAAENKELIYTEVEDIF